jgi:hypothetical protein
MRMGRKDNGSEEGCDEEQRIELDFHDLYLS